MAAPAQPEVRCGGGGRGDGNYNNTRNGTDGGYYGGRGDGSYGGYDGGRGGWGGGRGGRG